MQQHTQHKHKTLQNNRPNPTQPTLAEEHDLQGELEVQGHDGDDAEELADGVRQPAGGRRVQQGLLGVAGGDGHGRVHQREEGGVGAELDVVGLQVHGRLAPAQGLHHAGHQLGEDGQHRQLQVGHVREGHPAAWRPGQRGVGKKDMCGINCEGQPAAWRQGGKKDACVGSIVKDT